MPIPYWREVTYLEDGVSEYQCLNCYNPFYDTPWYEYNNKRSYSKTDWVCCPICQTKWIGKLKCKEGTELRFVNKKPEPPKRLTIGKYNLMAQCIYDDGTKSEPKIEYNKMNFKHALIYLKEERQKEMKHRETIDWGMKEVFWIECCRTNRKCCLQERKYHDRTTPIH